MQCLRCCTLVLWLHGVVCTWNLLLPQDSEKVDEGHHVPSPSEASDTSGATSRCLPTVKDNVKQGMFYC